MDHAVRIAHMGDVARIVDRTAPLGYDITPAAADERLRRFLQRPGDRFLVAEHDGRVAGWLHAVVADYIETGPFGVIAGLVVDRAVRKAGIGRALLAAAEQWAVEQGCQIVRLWSTAARTDAHRFDERLGYTNMARLRPPTSPRSFRGSIRPAVPIFCRLQHVTRVALLMGCVSLGLATVVSAQTSAAAGRVLLLAGADDPRAADASLKQE